jgi:putative SbcD/Mre11-related phosphoesterase
MLKLLLPHPAVLLKTGKKKTLVVADPHLGWEVGLQEKGIHVPSQTPRILQKLKTLLSEHKPDALVFLGDVKYTVVTAKLGEWQDIPEFFSELRNYVDDIAIIRGNHDANLEPLLPEDVKLLPATGYIVGDIGLFHGHKWPSPKLLGCRSIIMGHLHPVVVFRDPAGFKITRQVWMKVACKTGELTGTLLQKQGVKMEGTIETTLRKVYGVKPRTKQLFIMPSFNDFLGGRAVNETHPGKVLGSEALIGPVLRSNAVDVGKAELYLLDGTFLGTLNLLRQL